MPRETEGADGIKPTKTGQWHRRLVVIVVYETQTEVTTATGEEGCCGQIARCIEGRVMRQSCQLTGSNGGRFVRLRHRFVKPAKPMGERPQEFFRTTVAQMKGYGTQSNAGRAITAKVMKIDRQRGAGQARLLRGPGNITDVGDLLSRRQW